jgi:hypothetical protein
MKQNTYDLLESLMSGHLMTPSELDALLQNQVTEDLHLEYKHGDETKNPREASKTIREYLSGFANSEGGILIVGINEVNWTVTGCTAPGGGPLENWASDCIIPIGGYFSPPPRFQVIDHRKGKVLIASVSRSIGLVPCIESGKLVYHLRIHDKTIEAPDYLISDLILGRRQRPYLDLSVLGLDSLALIDEQPGFQSIDFILTFRLGNVGMLLAEDIIIGIIAFGFKKQTNPALISSYLLSHIEVIIPDEIEYKCELSRENYHIKRLDTFTNELFNFVPGINLPIRISNRSAIPYTWRAAVYVIAKSMPPIWYQLDIEISNQFLPMAKTSHSISMETQPCQLIKLERISGKRPIISWEKIT